MDKNYYEILGISQDASIEEIKSTYRKKAKQLHPDVSKDNNTVDAFKKVTEAYEVLSDPRRRQEYDMMLAYPGMSLGPWNWNTGGNSWLVQLNSVTGILHFISMYMMIV